jgi:thiamine biosynthesis protein ThiC
MEQTDAAQMDAARRGIVTEEMKKVAKKEGRDTTTSRQR